MKCRIDLPNRIRLAELAGIGEPYLYQCMTKRKSASAPLARHIETATGGEVMRWEVCKDWREIWPEMGERFDSQVERSA